MDGNARIRNAFETAEGMLLMTHVVSGYPDLDISNRLIAGMAEAGAGLIEVQIPFSDPIADGPKIVAANTQAVQAGITPDDVLGAIAKLAKQTSVPLLIMTYLNPVYHYGVEAFVKAAVEAGACGMIVPDCPPEEQEGAAKLAARCNDAGLAFVPLFAPGMREERMRILMEAFSSPFVYAVLRLGVTGRATEIDPAVVAYLESIRRVTGARIAGGFGIRTREQIQLLEGHVDCAVVGTAVLACVDEAAASGRDPVEAVSAMIAGLLRND